MKTNKTLLLIVQTALLLTLTLIFQSYVRLLIPAGIVNILVIGSLVNLCLFVAAGIVGWRGSVVIAVITPVAALMGQLPHPLLIPFVAMGNAVLVLAFELIAGKRDSKMMTWTAVGAASVIKFAVLYITVVQIFVPVILPGLGLKPRVAQALSLNFSWPQLVTALIGGIVGVPVIAAVRKALQHPQGNEAKA